MRAYYHIDGSDGDDGARTEEEVEDDSHTDRSSRIRESRYRVYLDGQPAFVLYRGELSRYHIRDGRELGEKDTERSGSCSSKGRRLRAMKLLEISDRSEEALRRKLSEGGYHGEHCGECRCLCEVFRLPGRQAPGRNISWTAGKDRRAGRSSGLAYWERAFQRTGGGGAGKVLHQASDAREAIRVWQRKKHFDPGAPQHRKSRSYAPICCEKATAMRTSVK